MSREYWKKHAKKIIIATTAIIVVLVVLAMSLAMPRNGKNVVDIWSVDSEFDINKIAKMDKKVGQDFKILLMADVQLWTNVGDNNKAFDIMDKLVQETSPDLIITLGDNVSGLTTDMLTRQFIKRMDSYKLPWATVFGNHDDEGNATLSWQADKFAQSQYCLFERGPSNLYGMGNYFINIWEQDKVVYSLSLLDNGRYLNYGQGIGTKEIYMGYEQIAWFEWNINGIAKAMGEQIPSMTFSHFAQPEFRTVMEKYAEKGQDGRLYVPESMGYGSCEYLPSASPVNSGFFQKAKSLGTTHIFSGHDHEHDAVIEYEGVTLGYGLKTGPSPRPWNDAKAYGGTVVTIGSDGVKMQNKVIQQVG